MLQYTSTKKKQSTIQINVDVSLLYSMRFKLLSNIRVLLLNFSCIAP